MMHWCSLAVLLGRLLPPPSAAVRSRPAEALSCRCCWFALHCWVGLADAHGEVKYNAWEKPTGECTAVAVALCARCGIGRCPTAPLTPTSPLPVPVPFMCCRDSPVEGGARE